MAEDNAEDFDIEDVEAQLQAQRDQRRKLRDARARSQVLLQECDLPNMTHPLSKTVTPFLVRFPTLKVHETSPEMKDSVKNAGAFFIPKGSEVIPLTEMPFNPTVQKQPYKNLMANKRYGILENAMRIVEDGMDWTLYNYIPNEKNFKNNPNLKAAVDAASAAGVKQATVRKDKKQAIELANEMRMSFCNNGPDSTAKDAFQRLLTWLLKLIKEQHQSDEKAFRDLHDDWHQKLMRRRELNRAIQRQQMTRKERKAAKREIDEISEALKPVIAGNNQDVIQKLYDPEIEEEEFPEMLIYRNAVASVHGFIHVTIPGMELDKAYMTALKERHPQKDYYVGIFKYLSKLVNHTGVWPWCPSRDDVVTHCKKPNKLHKPDLHIGFTMALPEDAEREVPWRVPMFLLEVEGGKDSWGKLIMHKAMIEGAITALSVLPYIYGVCIGHQESYIYYFARDPENGVLDCQVSTLLIGSSTGKMGNNIVCLLHSITAAIYHMLDICPYYSESVPEILESGFNPVPTRSFIEKTHPECWCIQDMAELGNKMTSNPDLQ